MVEPRQAGPEAVDTATSPQPYRPGGGGVFPSPRRGAWTCARRRLGRGDVKVYAAATAAARQ